MIKQRRKRRKKVNNLKCNKLKTNNNWQLHNSNFNSNKNKRFLN